jgi:formylmethanofuran dehydrogenase subunit E
MAKTENKAKTKKKKHCENCGIELNEGEAYELDGMILCRDCYNEEEDLRATEEEWME